MPLPTRTIARLVQITAITIVSLSFSAASAQVPTSGNVSFGYSYVSTGSLPVETGRNSLNGWEASLEGKVLPFIGLVADFGEQYGPGLATCSAPAGSIPGGSCSGVISHEQTFLFGPRVSMSVGKIRPFAEALFGAGHADTNGFGSDTSFAMAVGGGLDYKIIRLLAWRVQGAYVQSRFFGATQNSVRISTGIVFRF